MGNDGGGVVWARDSNNAGGGCFADHFAGAADGEIAWVAEGATEAID